MGNKKAFDRVEAPMKPVTDKEKEWLDQEIEIEFMNIEESGTLNKFCYGTTKDFKVYTLWHGGKYKLPRKIIQHIQSRQTPIWKYMPNGLGGMAKQLIGHKPRFQCREVFA